MVGVPKPKKPAKPESMVIYQDIIDRMMAVGKIVTPSRKLIEFPDQYFEEVTISHISLPNAAAVYMVRKGLTTQAEAARCAGVTTSRIAQCLDKCRRIHLGRAWRAERAARLAYTVGFVYAVIDASELTDEMVTQAVAFDCCTEQGWWINSHLVRRPRQPEVSQYELKVIWRDAIEVVKQAPQEWVAMTVRDAEGLLLGFALKRRERTIGSPNYRLFAETSQADTYGVKFTLQEQLNKAD